MKHRFRLPCMAATVLAASLLAPAWAADSSSTAGDSIVEGFRTPPPSARPRVWWHWMNGNVTQDGIRKDLQWMKRVGIGGLQNFDANLITPQVVEKRLAYMTPEWKDAFRLAARTADELGLELAIAASAGWSETGGPWVKAEDGMKKLVWSQADVQGGRRSALRLPAPPSVAGPFHDLPKDTDLLARLTGGKSFEAPSYYADAAVFAYPISGTKPLPVPRIAVNGQALDAAVLIDESLVTKVTFERPAVDKPMTLTVDFDSPQTVASATVALPYAVSALAASTLPTQLEVSTGEDSWRKLADVTLTSVPTTVSFAPVTARSFRLVIAHKPGMTIDIKPAPGADLSLLAAIVATKPTLDLAQLKLSPEPRVNLFEAKAGFEILPEYYDLDGNVGPEVAGIAPAQVIDLSDRMKPDGSLDWTPPKGHWRIVRLGYSLTGKVNHPATFEATGLEVDKYDRRAVRAYLEHYLGMYRDVVGPELMGRRGVQALLTDSIEFGASNWTPGLLDHFKRLRGYDARAFLPALTGAIVGSRRETEAFLYDFRRTLSDLLASEHYGVVAEVAHEQGLKVYGESLEGTRVALGDDMQLRKYADYPMAALWTFARDRSAKPSYLADMKGAASTAHFYGKTAVAAESLTSALTPWGHAPSDLRRIIDLEFATGISRPVIHTSVHQPLDEKQPGLSLSFFGQYFNRHETWAEMAGAWVDYIARNSFLLQQGRDVADVAYFHGEDAPLTQIFTDVPRQYAYDFVNADMVLNELRVDGSDLTSPGGARYRVLYLGGSSARMTLPVLRRLAALTEAGATIVGPAPKESPAFNENGDEYGALIKRLWPGQPSTIVGKGRVIASKDVEAALASLGVAPDFAYVKAAPDSEVLFVHRSLGDADVYFVNNRQNRPETFEARFRVQDRTPELWRADSGSIEPLSYRTADGVTVVPLEMAAEDSFFVVFRKPATGDSAQVEKPRSTPVMTIEGPWDVAFQPGRGAPAGTQLSALASLSEQSEAGIKYFSGVATYTRRISLPKGVKLGQPLTLDLGQVGDVAEVLVNGRSAGTAWHAPYQVAVGHLLRAGSNDIEVRVANLWVNRLIGDAQPDAKKITFVTIGTYRADAPLRPSGLIGPVRLLADHAASNRSK